MAVDHAIMEAVGQDLAPPSLRFYAWQPPCLSLGYGQSVADVDRHALQKKGWGLVRRATGGKAILHTDELTYSVALPKNSSLVAGGVVASYRRLSEALLLALRRLGAGVQSTPIEAAAQAQGPVCFEVPSNYEITVDGKKLIGSAQVRRQQAILQHGSLPLFGDISRICDALFFPDEQARQEAKARVSARATTLQNALGRYVEWQIVAESIATAFADTFNLSFESQELSATEMNRALELRDQYYEDVDWIKRR